MSYPLPSFLCEEVLALALSWGQSGKNIKDGKKGNMLEDNYNILLIAYVIHCFILEKEGSEQKLRYSS